MRSSNGIWMLHDLIFVRSCAGRDSGQLFFVVETDETYVYLADGKGTPAGKPEAKEAQACRAAAPA